VQVTSFDTYPKIRYSVAVMKLLYFAALLAVLQTAPPITRQAADRSASASDKIEKELLRTQAPAVNSPPGVNTATAPSYEDERNQQRTEDTDESLAISKLPPVTVNPTKRDWVDRGIWAFNGLLVFVGFLQWCVLRKQSKLMSVHAGHLKTLAGETRNNVAAIVSQSALLQDSAQRQLRAYVGVSRVRLNLQDKLLPVGLVEIQNFGKTPAYKVRHWTGIGVQPYPPIGPLPPSTATSFSVAVIHPNVKNVGAVELGKRLPDGAPIGTKDLTIYVYGEIAYQDAFAKEHLTKFRFFFGGSEASFTYRDPAPEGPVYGAIRADTNGNDAD
jgi:hypothetical protein